MTTEQTNPFTRAKEILGPDGENWGTSCQWDDGKICVEESIGSTAWRQVAQVVPFGDYEKARRILADVLTEQYPEEINAFSGQVIPFAWNDGTAGRDKTPEEVLAMLDKGEAKWDEVSSLSGDAGEVSP